MEYTFTTENFEAEVLRSDIPVFVDFYANWCGPCKMMAPIVEKLAQEYEGKVKVGKCDTEENMALVQKYRISNIPAFMVFRDGQAVSSFVGAMPAEDLRDRIEESIGK